MSFSDEALRDKIDELVIREVFGPERQEKVCGPCWLVSKGREKKKRTREID